MNAHDWKIHKILDETKRVYIYPARGNDKFYAQLELYAELMTQNKEVRVIRAKDVKDIIDILKQKPKPVPDFDVIDALERTHRYELFNDYVVKSEPKVILNTTSMDTSFWKEQMEWFAMNDCFIVTPEIEEGTECETE